LIETGEEFDMSTDWDCQNERPKFPEWSGNVLRQTREMLEEQHRLAPYDLLLTPSPLPAFLQALPGAFTALETPEQRETRLRMRPTTATSSDVMFLCRLLDESRILVAELAGQESCNPPSAAAIDVDAWVAGRAAPAPCDWIGALRRDYEPPI
jgi:hypothetical protein